MLQSNECLSGECFANVFDDGVSKREEKLREGKRREEFAEQRMAELKRLSDHEIEVTAFAAVGVVEANI